MCGPLPQERRQNDHLRNLVLVLAAKGAIERASFTLAFRPGNFGEARYDNLDALAHEAVVLVQPAVTVKP